MHEESYNDWRNNTDGEQFHVEREMGHRRRLRRRQVALLRWRSRVHWVSLPTYDRASMIGIRLAATGTVGATWGDPPSESESESMDNNDTDAARCARMMAVRVHS